MLQRQIRRADSRSRRARRAEELSAQSGALALVTNLVMAWNTHQMQGPLITGMQLGSVRLAHRRPAT
jgi:hypothetical protein